MTSCTSLHHNDHERRNILSFIIRDHVSQQELEPPSHHDGHPLLSEVTSLGERSNMNLTTIKPPFNMYGAMASSSSDVACVVLGRGPRRSACDEENLDRVELFQKNVPMTSSPQSQLLEIITEVLELLNDHDTEHHHFVDNDVSSCL